MSVEYEEKAPGLFVRIGTPRDVPIDGAFVKEITRGQPKSYRKSVLNVARSKNRRYRRTRLASRLAAMVRSLGA